MIYRNLFYELRKYILRIMEIYYVIYEKLLCELWKFIV